MNRTTTLGAGVALLFAATVGLLLHFIPGPHKPTDFLVIGALATLLCLLLLWIVLSKLQKKPDVPPKAENPE